MTPNTAPAVVELTTQRDPVMWTVHVIGPDDIHLFADGESAAEWASVCVRDAAAFYERSGYSEANRSLIVVILPPSAVSA